MLSTAKTLYQNPSFLKTKLDIVLIPTVFLLAVFLALVLDLPIQSIMNNYQYNVLVILIIMDLFTQLIASTGIMQFLASRIATLSKGNKRKIVLLFGLMMYLISAFLNNITAVMIIFPVITILLKSLKIDRKFVFVFLSVILALCNTGGASSPIGDFPAIVIMTSGITTFPDYLLRAMPVFFITSSLIVLFWLSKLRSLTESEYDKFSVSVFLSMYKHSKVNYCTLRFLFIVFIGMFLAWSFIPQEIIPQEIVAVLGYAIAVIISLLKGVRIEMKVDFKSILMTAAFLLIASVINETGCLVKIAYYFETTIKNPKLLLIAIMIVTSLVAGVFSAGPAAAAMMPVIISLSNTAFAESSHWVAIAYAAAICAGSSLFLWSATSGFIISDKVEKGKLVCNRKAIVWGVSEYFKYGITNYIIQISVAIVLIIIIV